MKEEANVPHFPFPLPDLASRTLFWSYFVLSFLSTFFPRGWLASKPLFSKLHHTVQFLSFDIWNYTDRASLFWPLRPKGVNYFFYFFCRNDVSEEIGRSFPESQIYCLEIIFVDLFVYKSVASSCITLSLIITPFPFPWRETELFFGKNNELDPRYFIYIDNFLIL